MTAIGESGHSGSGLKGSQFGLRIKVPGLPLYARKQTLSYTRSKGPLVTQSGHAANCMIVFSQTIGV
jgi:hypothetical protein